MIMRWRVGPIEVLTTARMVKESGDDGGGEGMLLGGSDCGACPEYPSRFWFDGAHHRLRRAQDERLRCQRAQPERVSFQITSEARR